MEREGSWPEDQLAPSPVQGAPPAVPNSCLSSISLTPNWDEQPNMEAILQCFGFRLVFASMGYPLCSLGQSTGCSWEEEIQFPSPQARAGHSFLFLIFF